MYELDMNDFMRWKFVGYGQMGLFRRLWKLAGRIVLISLTHWKFYTLQN